jgi:hypothetical protein
VYCVFAFIGIDMGGWTKYYIAVALLLWVRWLAFPLATARGTALIFRYCYLQSFISG